VRLSWDVEHYLRDSSCNNVGRESSIGIATRYWLDGPGIEFWCGRPFPHHCRPVLRPTQPPIQWVPGFFRG